MTATGLLRNSMINEEGGIDPEQFRMEAMFDRMDCIGKAILGLTIQCAQCHDHKYDPLTQEEYYKMFAFLNNAHEANVAVYTPGEQRRSRRSSRKTREIEALLRRQNPDWRERMAAWEKQVACGSTGLGGRTARSRRGIDRRPEVPADAGRLVPGPGIRADQAHRENDSENPAGADPAVRLELMNDPNLPLGGPGRSIKGTGA